MEFPKGTVELNMPTAFFPSPSTPLNLIDTRKGTTRSKVQIVIHRCVQRFHKNWEIGKQYTPVQVNLAVFSHWGRR